MILGNHIREHRKTSDQQRKEDNEQEQGEHGFQILGYDITHRLPPVSGKLPPDLIRRNGRIMTYHRIGAEREQYG